MISISKSGLVNYMDCPIKLKDMLDGKKIEGYQLERGTRVHFWIEYFWKRVYVENGQLHFPQLFPAKDEEKFLLNFQSFLLKLWKVSDNKVNNFLPRGIEKVVEVNKKFDGEDVKLKGIIDLVAGKTVVDWKTGKMKDDYKWDVIYYAYVMNEMGEDIENGLIVSLYDGSLLFVDVRKDFKNLEDIIKNMIQTIKNNDWKHKEGCSCFNGKK